MYLGGLVMLTGWAILLSNVVALLFLPAFVLYINRFQIVPEERALAALFGQASPPINLALDGGYNFAKVSV
jgi:protein-S-isoprenylcysteine O-methyltransferase Ste14